MKRCFNCKKLPTIRVDNEEVKYPYVVEHTNPLCPYKLTVYHETVEQAEAVWNTWVTEKALKSIVSMISTDKARRTKSKQ